MAHIVQVKIRVVYFIHFCPDPDPENLNFKNQIPIMLALI